VLNWCSVFEINITVSTPYQTRYKTISCRPFYVRGDTLTNLRWAQHYSYTQRHTVAAMSVCDIIQVELLCYVQLCLPGCESPTSPTNAATADSALRFSSPSSKQKKKHSHMLPQAISNRTDPFSEWLLLINK